jgi:structural maintenance of chromosome 3 (chondroitin sulfate proteoglycan 6)
MESCNTSSIALTPHDWQIFGKTLICRDLEVATVYSRNYNLDCITLEGDQVNRKGALTGGYYDIHHSRLESMKSIKNWRNKIEQIIPDARKTKKILQETEQEISSLLGEIQKLETARANSRDTYEQLNQKVKTLQRDMVTFQEILQQKEQTLATVTHTLKELTDTRTTLEREIGTELLSQLSSDEQRELEQLSEQITNLKKELIQTSRTRAEVRCCLGAVDYPNLLLFSA